MAQLSIRDKDYRPNQYLNPMLISGGREPDMDSSPYRIFDKTNPEHPDYEGNKDDDGPEYEQLRIPTVKGKKNKSMTIANLAPKDFIPFSPATRDNDGFAMPYIRTPAIRQMELDHFIKFIQETSGNNDFVQRNTPMKIAGVPFLKTVGDGNIVTDEEYEAALKQIKQITNPLARQLAESRLVDQRYLGLDPV